MKYSTPLLTSASIALSLLHSSVASPVYLYKIAYETIYVQNGVEVSTAVQYSDKVVTPTLSIAEDTTIPIETTTSVVPIVPTTTSVVVPIVPTTTSVVVPMVPTTTSSVDPEVWSPTTTSSSQPDVNVYVETSVSAPVVPTSSPITSSTSSSSPVVVSLATSSSTSVPPVTSSSSVPATSSSSVPAASSSSSSSGSLDSYAKSIVDSHNTDRSYHSAPSMTWNETLAEYAQNYLDNSNCVFKHSGGPYGENLAWGYSSAEAGIAAWYNEGKSYNYAAAEFSESTGHFTQVVWVHSTQVGCATITCSGSQYLACEYYPRGNIIGEFAENVLES